MSVLAQAGCDDLERAWRKVGPREIARWIRPAETGLVMVRGRAGATGGKFNLGEMTATRCAVQIAGTDLIGYALTAGRDKRKAELAALLDAVFQEIGDNADLIADISEPLRQTQQKQRQIQAAKASATRVNFFTVARGD